MTKEQILLLIDLKFKIEELKKSNTKNLTEITMEIIELEEQISNIN